MTASAPIAALIARDTGCPRDIAQGVGDLLLRYAAVLTLRAEAWGVHATRRTATLMVSRVLRQNYEHAADIVVRLVTPPPARDLRAEWLARVMEAMPD